MKKYSTNYAIKILGLTLIAFVAIVKPAFCQTNWLDYALENWVVSVSPDQQVKLRLPKDIRSGDQITGSVIEEKKNNSGEVNNASSRLEGVVIEIDGKQTKLSNRLISFLVPAGLTSLPFVLKNSAGEVIERGQIPIGIFSYFDTRWQEPVGGLGAKFTPLAVAQPGQTFRVTGSFDGNAANTNVSISGQACEIIAESPRECFIQVSQNATAGVSNLSINENNVIEEHKINVAVLNLSANKTNLRKGEKTTLKVTVSGLENITADKMNFKLRVENHSPQTISFMKEGSNVITKELSAGTVNNGVYEFSTRIIALTAGVFTVAAYLTDPNKDKECLQKYQDCMAVIKAKREAGLKKCKESGSAGVGVAQCELDVNTASDKLEKACWDNFEKCRK